MKIIILEVLKMKVFCRVEEKMSKIEKMLEMTKFRKFAYSEEKRILLGIYKIRI